MTRDEKIVRLASELVRYQEQLSDLEAAREELVKARATAFLPAAYDLALERIAVDKFELKVLIEEVRYRIVQERIHLAVRA